MNSFEVFGRCNNAADSRFWTSRQSVILAPADFGNQSSSLIVRKHVRNHVYC